jgi:RNA-directed DNA polymerase
MLTQMWNNIDWHSVQENVSRLQARITKAATDGKTNQARRLSYLLTHSFCAKALAVKRVTTNKGKRTAGVDGKLWLAPSQKMQAVLSLTDKEYKAQSLKRVYIKKKGKKAKRPLGIPTMYDRAMQALHALALDPIAEARADGNSYGFRRGRCAHDARDRLFATLSHKVSAQWMLEGDIKGCFDNISHDWLLANIPMDKTILKQFLKAGYVFQGKLFPTDSGTPQGGIISVILANMCLDGMQGVLAERFSFGVRTGKYTSFQHNKHKVTFALYADDFVATATTREIAQEAKGLLQQFLLRGDLSFPRKGLSSRILMMGLTSWDGTCGSTRAS